MTRTVKNTVKIFTIILVTLVSIMVATPAQAVVNEDSRVVVVHLPKVAESRDTAIIIANFVDGSVLAYITHTDAGVARIMFDNPSLIKTLKARVGNKNYRVNGFTVTAIGATPESYGASVSFEFQGVDGEWKLLNIDGSVTKSSAPPQLNISA